MKISLNFFLKRITICFFCLKIYISHNSEDFEIIVNRKLIDK